MWAAVAAMAWLTLPAPASATDSYLYCKGYSQGRNVITPIIVDSPSVGQQWDAYLKSGGFSGGGCRSSFKERDVVAQMRDDLMRPPLSFQPIQWTPRPFQQTSNQTVAIPNPVLLPIAIEQYTESGKQFIRYHFDVTNKTSYPAELFRASPDLPPCGANKRASRTWVEFFDEAEKRIYGYCATGAPEDLGSISFAREEGVAPPAKVYIVMTDRLTNTRYKSNPVPAVNAAATKLVAGWKVTISGATCTMEKRTLGDYATTLNIALWRSGQIDMMLQSTRWQFGKHSSRSASLYLDPGKSKAPAYQGRESLWQVGERGVITFQPTASLLTDFANSREMRLSVEDFSLSETYDISGAALALAELRNCTARHAKA